LNPSRVKYWEIIADNLSKAGWSLGYVLALDFNGERSGLLTRTGMGKKPHGFDKPCGFYW
jgi:hypothetical protein